MKNKICMTLLSSLISLSIHAQDLKKENVQEVAKAAAQDDAVTQSNLGLTYFLGLGVPQDYSLAKQWFEKAAAQGDDIAQYYLGLMYFHGLGVPQNYFLAKQWFEKAATQGGALAQYNLGVMYDQGLGVMVK